MLATGGSVICCIEKLMGLGVAEGNITFVNSVGCPNGIERLCTKYPKVKVLAASIDPYLLTDSKYIAPGLGDYGCRFFGTDN